MIQEFLCLILQRFHLLLNTLLFAFFFFLRNSPYQSLLLSSFVSPNQMISKSVRVKKKWKIENRAQEKGSENGDEIDKLCKLGHV